jgi:hypothetical protein
MNLEEAILDKVRRIAPSEQEELFFFADGLERRLTAREVPTRNRSREMEWIDENRPT